MIQEFHARAFPDLFYDGSQFLVGLLKVTCSEPPVNNIYRKNVAVGFSTFGFDLESSPDQSEKGGVEGDRAIAVQRHVHANQPLQG